MKKVGFIDILSIKDGMQEGNIYVFADRSGNDTLESSMEFASDRPFPLNTSDVSDFTLSLPIGMLNFRVLNLPFSDREKLQKVVPFEIENLILESAENVVFDVTVLGPSGDTFDVLVTYIEKAALQKILDALSSFQVDPRVVTSLELQTGLKGGVEGIAARLANQERPTPEERVAAALHELQNRTLNLRTGSLAYTGDAERVRKKMKITAALLVALALIVNSSLIFGIVTAKSESSSLKKDLRNTYAALFPAEKKITDELYQMKSHMKEMKEKGDTLVGVNPLKLLLDLSQKTPQGISFYEIAFDRDLVTMKGDASSMKDIDTVKTRLSFLGDVSVSEIKPSAEGKTLFTLIARGRK